MFSSLSDDQFIGASDSEVSVAVPLGCSVSVAVSLGWSVWVGVSVFESDGGAVSVPVSVGSVAEGGAVSEGGGSVVVVLGGAVTDGGAGRHSWLPALPPRPRSASALP